MSLNIGVARVDLLDDNRLQVTVGVSVTGFNESESYSGQVSVANAPSSDFVEIDGTVGTGAGDEYVVTLDAGLTDDDLPTDVLITAALDDGTQEQAAVEVSSGGGAPPGNGTAPGDGGGDGDGLSTREWAAIGAGAVGTGYALNRLLDN